jgi:K+ transporter
VAKASSALLMAPFIYLHRTMQSATEYFKIPYDHAIEIGGHVEI